VHGSNGLGPSLRKGKEPEAYKTSGVTTIQFPLDEPLPTALIGKIVKQRLEDAGRKDGE